MTGREAGQWAGRGDHRRHRRGLPPSAAQDELWEGFFSQHYSGAARGAGRADLRQLRGAHPAGGGQPAARGRLRLVHRAPDAPLPGRGHAAGQGGGRPGADRGRAWPPASSGCSWSAPAPGYATPGLDILLARDLGMSPNAQRLFVGHMGCYAALPGLGTVADFVAARRPAGAAALRRADQPAPPAAGTRGHPADRLARALLGRRGRRRGLDAGRPGVRGARGRRGHRHLDRRPHDLGRHRPRVPDGPVAPGTRCPVPPRRSIRPPAWLSATVWL